MEPLGNTPEEAVDTSAHSQTELIREVRVDYSCEPHRAGMEVWNEVRFQFDQYAGDIVRTELNERELTLQGPPERDFCRFVVRVLPEEDNDPAIMHIYAAGTGGLAKLEIRCQGDRIRDVNLKKYEGPKLCKEGRAECIKQDFFEPISKAVPAS